MGRHDADPQGRPGYVLAAVAGLVLIALLVVGISALRSLAGV